MRISDWSSDVCSSDLSRKGRYRRVRSQIRKAVKAQFGLRPYAVPARGSTGRGRRERQTHPCPTALPLGYGRGSSFLSSIPFCMNWTIKQRTDLHVQNQLPSVSTMSSWKLQQSSKITPLPNRRAPVREKKEPESR